MHYLNTHKTLIVLDLDETLIHATSETPDGKWLFELFGYKVFERPYLQEFLLFLQNHFLVGVWSSASDDYVEKVVSEIFPENYPLAFVWGRSRCTFQTNYNKLSEFGYSDHSHYNYVKRLSKLKKYGYCLKRILIIDDTPEKCRYNYGNAIYPKAFTGNPADKELLLLQTYLKTLVTVENVRTIEKRYWRESLEIS